ncbi:hypothetical protein PV733_36685 [Streptomyces europaeiscabiei]|uniref:hypothetical protein n=1 Tax=Streptomyces europaeiscabiei TaxID=146819 RepID=UPI0029B7B091|nr:hypothetical protein [Streptomyces europaeiscabiei]MDX3714368.1 hypothetical protein [Streptomyces europaeiscabiei]
MTARQTVWTAAHWTACTIAALLLAGGLPFTGLYATATSVVIAAGVGLVGIAAAPHTRKEHT